MKTLKKLAANIPLIAITGMITSSSAISVLTPHVIQIALCLNQILAERVVTIACCVKDGHVWNWNIAAWMAVFIGWMRRRWKWWISGRRCAAKVTIIPVASDVTTILAIIVFLPDAVFVAFSLNHVMTGAFFSDIRQKRVRFIGTFLATL